MFLRRPGNGRRTVVGWSSDGRRTVVRRADGQPFRADRRPVFSRAGVWGRQPPGPQGGSGGREPPRLGGSGGAKPPQEKTISYVR